jgi:hypothetical protein
MSKINDSRSYGQGAQGEPDAPQAQKVSFFTRLRYNFDNSLSKPGAFVGYVFIAIIFLAQLLLLIVGA